MISIRVPLYGALVYVSLTDDPGAARVDASDVFGPYEHEGAVADAICAYGAAVEGKFGLFFSTKQLKPGVIAHELFHLSVHIAAWVNIPVEQHNHEAVAYLHGWLTDEVHKVIDMYRKQHRKKPRTRRESKA